MATNTASLFNTGGAYGTGDVEQYIAEKTLPLVQRQLVVYKLGVPIRLPKGRGTTYAASRYDRVNLPFTTLQEGVPPVGVTMPLAQVSATVQQWGSMIPITDVADLTIKHPLFQKAIELVALQLAETVERNTFNSLLTGTQFNTVNSRGARGSILSTDVLSSAELNRATAMMINIGAPLFLGTEQEDIQLNAEQGGARASGNPRTMPHYVTVIHPFVATDLRKDTAISTAWQYSDVNRLYNFEVGEWAGQRFIVTNLVPFFTGIAAVTGTAATTGSLATGTYKITVAGGPATGTQTLPGMEQQVTQISAGVSVTGPNGSITFTTPNVPGFVWNAYISAAGGSTTPNLATSPQGPTTGLLAGQAVQLANNTSITLTGIGVASTPPAAPATGVSVYPSFIIGKGSYGQVLLDDARFSYLKQPDKSDPLNQLRIVGWKIFYGTLILNNSFFMRIESASSVSATFA